MMSARVAFDLQRMHGDFCFVQHRSSVISGREFISTRKNCQRGTDNLTIKIRALLLAKAVR
jgi:hypothetical protein